jgi:long-chain acyl-CoA synthetase
VDADALAQQRSDPSPLRPGDREHPLAGGSGVPHRARRARNLVELLLRRTAQPDACAALHCPSGRLEEVTWGQLLDRIRAVSEGLVALGVRPGDRVCILAPTRLDWCVADLAAMGAGGVTVPIYASNTAAEIEHVVRDSGARVVFVDGEHAEGGAPGRWSRLRVALPRLPAVDHVVAFDLPGDAAGHVLSLAELEARGRARLAGRPHPGLEERSAALGPDDLACICYTTGTTGVAKGVLLTHGNWTSQAHAIPQVGLMAEDDVVLLFLPLAHSFGKLVEAAWIDQGFPLAFARSPETIMEDAAAVRATAIPAVPRVFEKIYARVVRDASALPGVRGRVFRWAMRQFDRHAAARIEGREVTSLRWRIARRLVFRKIGAALQARFGGRMKGFISGSAPLSRRLSVFFDECGLPVLEGYGLTETTAPTHVNRLDFIRLGTVGLPFPGVETRIADDGEILVRGPQVMKGYHGSPAMTAEVLDDDGWLHTGDIGEVDADGCLRITDRKKDLIKTSGGKYLAPQHLEQALSGLPLVSQAVVVGDRRRFVAALLTVDPEEGAAWASAAGLGQLAHGALLRSPALRAQLQAGVDQVNAGLPTYSQIRKFAILERELTIDDGELTAKLSVRRKLVTERYGAVIDALYGDAVLE